MSKKIYRNQIVKKHPFLNFCLGQNGWFSGQVKNLPPNHSSQQTISNEMTPVNTFESDVMGIMPAPAFSSVDEVPNQGFTPLNSFESDVLEVTPVDC